MPKITGFICFVFLLVSSLSCTKKKVVPATEVVYTVVETSTSEPVYSITYSTASATQTQGPISESSWISPIVKDLKRGQYVKLQANLVSGTGTFRLAVYLNRVQVQQTEADAVNGKVELELYLPPEM